MPFELELIRGGLALVEEPARIIAKGQAFDDWFEVDIDSDIFTPADGFSMTGVVPAKSLDLFREGNSLDVYVGDDRQMAGVVDDLQVSVGKVTRVTVAGRDKGAFLVDGESKAFHFSSYDLKSLAEKLLDPSWGIKNVIVSNEDNRRVLLGRQERSRFHRGTSSSSLAATRRDEVKIDPGRRVAELLTTHCGRAGRAWWLTAQGDLFIGKPQYSQDAVYDFFRYAPDSKDAAKNNVLEANVRHSMGERFSEIAVVGQARDFGAGSTNDKRSKKFRGVATDPDLIERGIVRKTIISDIEALSDAECQKRAEEEMQRRRLAALTINLTVQGFKQNGRLFAIDTLANVKIEEAGIDGQFYVTQRRFREEKNQRRTQLTLHEKGVWLP